jgi:hypothetical protein
MVAVVRFRAYFDYSCQGHIPMDGQVIHYVGGFIQRREA